MPWPSTRSFSCKNVSRRSRRDTQKIQNKKNLARYYCAKSHSSVHHVRSYSKVKTSAILLNIKLH